MSPTPASQSAAAAAPTPPKSIVGAPGNPLYLGQIYGSRDGRIVGCNIEIISWSPAPSLGIDYGLAMACNDSGIRGQAISHLGEFYPRPLHPLQSGEFFSVAGAANTPAQWKTKPYTRNSDDQLEQIYAFFSLSIDGAGSTWQTTPTVGGTAYDIQCSPTGQSTITCAMVTLPFAFIPEGTNCVTGALCQAVSPGTASVGYDACGESRSFNSEVPAGSAIGLMVNTTGNVEAGLPFPDTDPLSALLDSDIDPTVDDARASLPDELGGVEAANCDAPPSATVATHRSFECQLSGRVYRPETTAGFVDAYGTASPFCTYASLGTKVLVRTCLQRRNNDGTWPKGKCRQRIFRDPSPIDNLTVTARSRCPSVTDFRDWRTSATMVVRGGGKVQKLTRRSPVHNDMPC